MKKLTNLFNLRKISMGENEWNKMPVGWIDGIP